MWIRKCYKVIIATSANNNTKPLKATKEKAENYEVSAALRRNATTKSDIENGANAHCSGYKRRKKQRQGQLN